MKRGFFTYEKQNSGLLITGKIDTIGFAMNNDDFKVVFIVTNINIKSLFVNKSGDVLA